MRAPRCESSPGCRVAGQMPPASRRSAERLSTRMSSPQQRKPVFWQRPVGHSTPAGAPTTGTLPASQWVRGQGEVGLASDPKFHRVYFLKVESEEEERVSQWRLWKRETILSLLRPSPFFFFIFISPVVWFLTEDVNSAKTSAYVCVRYVWERPETTPTLSVAVRMWGKKRGRGQKSPDTRQMSEPDDNSRLRENRAVFLLVKS